MENIIILVQKYSKDPANYVYCKVLEGGPNPFRLHKNYISKFTTKLQIDTAYAVEYRAEPSECGQFTNISVNVLAKLSEEAKLKYILGS